MGKKKRKSKSIEQIVVKDIDIIVAIICSMRAKVYLTALYGHHKAIRIIRHKTVQECIPPSKKSKLNRVLKQLDDKQYKKRKKKTNKTLFGDGYKAKYHEYLETPAWQKKRRMAFKKYGRVCSECNSTEKLCVHHKTYENIFNEKVEDLQILCWICHEKLHLDQREARNNPTA